jgi:glutathione synthase/RimK-type ligase-like ATP-grasp enzyme
MKEKSLILSYKTCFPSCRLLRQFIEEITGTHYLLTDDPDKNHIVSYGHSGSQCEFNSSSFIGSVCNKLTFSNLLLENGFYTPEYVNVGIPPSFPVLIRETLTSYGGKGITLVENREEFESKWRGRGYWTPFINVSSEYRIHVLGTKIARIFKKVRSEELEEEKYPIRNNDRGYHFSIRENFEEFKELNKQLPPLLEYLYSLGGKFFALDIGWDRKRNKYFIFEANSAPGLNENTANEYAQYLVKELQLK